MLGEEPSGILKFNFTLNPVALKDAEKQIKKASDEGDLKKADMLRSNQNKPAEAIDSDTVSKLLTSD